MQKRTKKRAAGVAIGATVAGALGLLVPSGTPMHTALVTCTNRNLGGQGTIFGSYIGYDDDEVGPAPAICVGSPVPIP